MKWRTLVALGLLFLCPSSSLQAQDADVPSPIGTRTCLFLDDRYIAEQSGLTRTWHQGRPQTEVAIQAGSDQWERWPHLFGSVLYDSQSKLYRMYYESAISPSRTPPNSFTTYVCYAESADGKQWTKPRLRLFDDLGSKDNNIVIHCAEFAKVFLDPLEQDPAARLKMFVYLNGKPPLMGGSGECLLASGDGLHWKFVAGFNKPPYARAEQGNFTDSYCFQFDPLQQRYMAYIRTFDQSKIAESKDGRRRAVGIAHSRQVNRNWSPIVQVLAPDELDDARVSQLSRDPARPDWAEHYCMPLFVYGNHYLGMLSLLYFIDGSDSNGGGDIQLTFSHDGSTWFRQPQRQTLIAASNSAPELFPTYVSINGPVEIGDELWLYYTEANGAHPVRPFEKAVSQIRAAVWRRDGFVSLDAGDSGCFTTRPLLFDGKSLVINARCAAGGNLRLAILGGDGQPLPGLDLNDCEPIRGDQVRGTVRWGSRSDLSQLQGQTIRLRVKMSNCSLYSFRVNSN